VVWCSDIRGNEDFVDTTNLSVLLLSFCEALVNASTSGVHGVVVL
jgi:hypothetical protein